MGEVVSFQIVQGYSNHGGVSPSGTGGGGWSPDVVALCKDGSLWTIGLRQAYEDNPIWIRITPEPTGFRTKKETS